jgi:hypothetical protein
MFWFQARSVEELSSTANANSTAQSNADPADYIRPSPRSINAHSSSSENANAITETRQPDADSLKARNAQS